jgi:tetratricopeptide (TPR) repeat protein
MARAALEQAVVDRPDDEAGWIVLGDHLLEQDDPLDALIGPRSRGLEWSKALDNERDVLVYTPPGWKLGGAPYPLVVMFDGPPAVVRLGLPIVLDELIAIRQIPPVVVLIVDNVDRDKELPGNAAFADFVALDLLPWVRRGFHVTDDPRRTVRFPGAAAAHDGLGDAYWHAGERARAVASYQRSLAIDPKNDHAKAMIEVLR